MGMRRLFCKGYLVLIFRFLGSPSENRNSNMTLGKKYLFNFFILIAPGIDPGIFHKRKGRFLSLFFIKIFFVK